MLTLDVLVQTLFKDETVEQGQLERVLGPCAEKGTKSSEL